MKLRHKKPLNSYRADHDDDSSVLIVFIQELFEDDFHNQNVIAKKVPQ